MATICKFFSAKQLLKQPLARSLTSLKTSYVYHPKTETLEADIQALLWTKTKLTDQQPSCLSDVGNNLKLDVIESLIPRTILASRTYERQEVKMKYKNKPRDLTRGSHENFPFSLVLNLFRMIQNHSQVHPQLRDLNLLLEPYISASWPCGEDTISVRGKIDMILNRKTPLQRFYDSETVEKTANYDFSDIENSLKFVDVKQFQVKNEFCTGAVSVDTVFPHPHMLVVLDNSDYRPPPAKAVPEIQLIQRGLVFTFAQLCARAVAKHGREIIGQELPSPETAQCLVTNGQVFSFIWYQLNTLSTGDVEGGVKNLACVHRPGPLYKALEPDGIFRKTVSGLDSDVLRTIVSSFLI